MARMDVAEERNIPAPTRNLTSVAKPAASHFTDWSHPQIIVCLNYSCLEQNTEYKIDILLGADFIHFFIL
jgi:hypothetical protein